MLTGAPVRVDPAYGLGEEAVRRPQAVHDVAVPATGSQQSCRLLVERDREDVEPGRIHTSSASS